MTNCTEVQTQVRELEKMISLIQGVSDVVVVLAGNAQGKEVIKAFVEPEEDTGLSEQAIINHCLKSCHKAPSTITFTTIPRTPSGKVARMALLEKYAV
ncbi:MAG: AMP-binding enzyme [Bacillota bacterium]